MKKLTYEEVYDYFLNNNVLLLSNKYINNTKPLELLCLNCGEVFKKSLNKFKSGQTCSTCKINDKNKKMHLYIKYYISKYGYTLISKEYNDAHGKLEMICPGHKSKINWNNFKTGKRCKECNNKKQRLTKQEVYNKMKKEGHELLSEYKTNRTELKIKCPNGHIYYRTYNYFINNMRCPTCKEKEIESKRYKKYEWVKNTINKEGYKLLTDTYINNKQTLKIQCDKGHIYDTNFNYFQQGCRCNICNSSKGNKKIKDILDKFNIYNKPEYKFKDCKFKKKLPFDFYLPDYNLIVEFDGIQHYEMIEHFGGYDGFISRKIRDTIKNIYCRNNNIDLLRIPYWEFDNIENILINKLNLK